MRNFLVLLVLGSVFSQAAPLPLDPAVRHGVLANGLTYYIRQNSKPADRLELRLAVNAGSCLEEDDQQGLAHFLEHAAFNGTQHFEKQEMVDFLEALGVGFGPDLNAYTSFDETVYQLKLPTTDPTVVEKGFLILSDWAHRITASDEALESERGVVIEEWRGRRGAEQRIRDLQYPVLFAGSRYAERLPIGTIEVLETFEFDRLRTFYQDWYRPDLTGIVVVGDADPDEMEALVRKHFESIPKSMSPKPLPSFSHPAHSDTNVGLFSDPELTKSEIAVVWKHPHSPLKTREDYRKNLLNRLVVDMLQVRLAERSQSADAPFLEAGGYRGNYTRGGDVFLLYTSVKDESGAHVRGLQALLEEAERAKRFGFTPAEVQRVIAKTLRQTERMYNERETTESKRFVKEYVRHYLEGTAAPGIGVELELQREMLAGITAEELNPLIGTWMPAENRVILGEGPQKQGKDFLPSDDEVLEVLEGATELVLEPYEEELNDEPLIAEPPEAGTIVKKETIPELGLHLWTLSNGCRVLLKPTEFKKDQVLMSAWSAGGHSLASDADYIPAATAAGAINSGGVGAFSAIDLRKKLSDTLTVCAPVISELQEGLKGSTTPEDLQTLFELVRLYFTKPRADSDAFSAFSQRQAEQLRNRDQDPRALFAALVDETMANHHPRAVRWTPHTVERFDENASLAFYRDRFADAGDFNFLFVGAFTLEQMEPLVSRWIASLPSTGRTEAWRDVGVRYPEQELKRVIRMGVEPVGQVQMVWTQPEFEWNYENRHAVFSMLAVLRIKLREVVREKLGGSYHVSVWPELKHYPTSQARVRVAFGCAPENVEELIAAVKSEVQGLQTNLVEASYLTKVTETQLRGRETDLKRNEFWTHVLSYYDWHAEDPRVILDFESYVAGIDAESVRETAKQCFDVPDRAVFVLLPGKK